jgi:hypothetical protein
MLVVYKPDRGESPLYDFPRGTLSRREALTWEASHLMGMTIVPETQLADGPLGFGSIQRFIDEDPHADPRFLLDGPDERLWPAAVLDLVCNNADRKLGHLIAETGSGKWWAIDHGLTFHPSPKLRTVLWGFAGRSIPAHLIDGIRRLRHALDSDFGDRVSELLSPLERNALHRRCSSLIDDPIHPLPPTDRPALPWPLM